MQTFKKKERLTEKKIIQDLFDNGNAFYVSPVRVLWKFEPSKKPFIARILITVSSRTFRKSVERNRIRRFFRESYRKNKHLLYENKVYKTGNLLMVFQFAGRTMPAYKDIEPKIIIILHRLLKMNEKSPG